MTPGARGEVASHPAAQATPGSQGSQGTTLATSATGSAPDIAYIGLGANLGDPAATLRAAVVRLKALPQTRLCALSSVYASAPVDAQGPTFFNAVAAVETGLGAQALLAELHRIEADHGRERPYRNAPRTLDLDLLLHGQCRSQVPALQLPHPRLHLRAFVLQPLLELAPQLEVPGLGRLADHLPATADQPIARIGLPRMLDDDPMAGS